MLTTPILSLKLRKTVAQSCSVKKNVEACNFIKKQTLVQVFFCEFCENFKNTFFYRTPPVVASGRKEQYDGNCEYCNSI